MKSTGNGRPEQCAANLMMIIRGEVPYERIKGLDARMIDRPSSTAVPEIRADAEWVLRTYEPRIRLDRVGIENLLAAEGNFGLNAGITEMGVVT